MHFYPYHIGDFRSGTFNMTRMERWIYRDMLDVYYDNELPFPDNLEKICAMVGARRDEDKEAVASILLLKFEHSDAGYVHTRCEKEIAAYKAKSETAKSNGKKSAATRYQNGEYMPTPGALYAVRIDEATVKVGVSGNLKSRVHQLRAKYGKQAALIYQVDVAHMGDAEADLLEVYAETRSGEELPCATSDEVALFSHMDRMSVAYKVASSSHGKSHTNQEPVTSNQEPKRRADARGTRLPDDWKPSHEDALYCKTTRPDLRPSEVAQSFYDFWIAKPGAAGRKADWAATWRTWVRNEKPGKESVAPKEKDWI